MDFLLTDIARRHKSKIFLPFTLGDDMLVVDLLACRSTDVWPQRLLAVDQTGRGSIKISTCYPDPEGEYQRPVGDPKTWYLTKKLECLSHIQTEYEVVPALVETLKRDGVLITGKQFKVAHNECVLHFDWYQRLREAHGDIEYRAVLN